jgi:hypothetical protein
MRGTLFPRNILFLQFIKQRRFFGILEVFNEASRDYVYSIFSFNFLGWLCFVFVFGFEDRGGVLVWWSRDHSRSSKACQ